MNKARLQAMKVALGVILKTPSGGVGRHVASTELFEDLQSLASSLDKTLKLINQSNQVVNEKIGDENKTKPHKKTNLK